MVFNGCAMLDSCLDSRIAEAAAAVEALRREKEKLDSQILHHRSEDDITASIKLDETPCYTNPNLVIEETNEAPIRRASCSGASQNAILERLEQSCREEVEIRPGSAASYVPHCIFWAPQPFERADASNEQTAAPVAVGLSEEVVGDHTPAHQSVPDFTCTEKVPLPTIEHCENATMLGAEQSYDLWVLSPAKSQTCDASDERVRMQNELPQDNFVATIACAFPVPPSVPSPKTRPPRRVPTRPKQHSEQANCNYPSDVVVASMSRRERIDLLEKEDGSGLEPLVSRHEHDVIRAVLDDTGPNFERAVVSDDVECRRDRNSGVIQDSLGDCGNVVVRQRHPPIEHRQPPSALDFPTDEAVAQMSRRERIALLERAESGTPDSEALPPQFESSTLRHRGNSATRSRLDIANRNQIGVSRLTGILSRQTASPDQESLSQFSADDCLDDEAWLEQRRQSRKMRLQRIPRLEASHGKDGTADVWQVGSGDASFHNHTDPDVRRTMQAARVEGRRRIPRSGTEGEGKADELHANGGAAAGRSLAEELEELARLSTDDPKWVSLCRSLVANAHKLSSGALVRVIQIVASLSISLYADANTRESLATNVFRAAVDAVLVCITPQLGSLSIGVIVDALTAMASINIEEQSYLDMLLAQLLVLLRREPGNFSPGKLSAIARAIGSLHVVGVSAKRAGSGPSSVANQRCLDALAGQISARLNDFTSGELGRIGGTFMITFVDDTLRRSLLHRAAEIEAGLAIGASRIELTDMQDIERSLRQHSFTFIASLPDRTKDYLTKLKAAPAPAAGTETVTGCS